MVHSRRKGHTRERKIRHRFIAAGWPDAKRGDQSRAGHEESDVCVGPRTVSVPVAYDTAILALVAVPGFHCEVKDQLTLPGKRPMAALDQAIRTCPAGHIPMAIFHVARRGDYALLELGDVLRLASCGTADGRSGGDCEPLRDAGECEPASVALPEEKETA